jgi:hypothetical protein
MSKKKPSKIPRDHYVVGHTAGVVSRLTLTIDPVTLQPSILELDPSSLRSQISHARQNGKGDKVLVSTPTDDFAALDESFITQLQKKFDYLVAVDTNTELDRIDGYKVSACCVCGVLQPLASLTDRVPYQTLACHLILDSGDMGNAERLGWHLVATVTINTPFLRTQRIGVVVDSELADHVAINARTKPYYGDHFLPENVSLVYASSDKIETLVNEMIRLNDKNAVQLIKAVKREGIPALQLQGGVQYGTATVHCIEPFSRGVPSPETSR